MEISVVDRNVLITLTQPLEVLRALIVLSLFVQQRGHG